MKDEIEFGSVQIEYSWVYAQRKTLGITVTPEMSVLVRAPEDTPKEKIREKVKKRAPWILKQKSFFLNFHPKGTPRKYINGETHLYMGRRYQLNISIGLREEVKYKGRFIYVQTKSKKRVKLLLKSWYRQRAEKKFNEIAKPLINEFKSHGKVPSGLYLKEMSKRWGSCTPKGKIILNTELIKAPRACIEYVIVHELCHLIHPKHTQRFFDLQTKHMPDWEIWKERLERILS